MSDLKLSHLMTDSSLAPALKPAFPILAEDRSVRKAQSLSLKMFPYSFLI